MVFAKHLCPRTEGTGLQQFLDNFLHTLCKPLLLLFDAGFLIPLFRVKLEFPKAVYQLMTIYLLLAIGVARWRRVGRA